MTCENGYKITQEEIREKIEVNMQKATLLDFNQDYWKRFIKEEKLDKDALVKAGYNGPGQAEWIEAEMVKLGWLPGAKEVVQFAADAGYVPTALPLSERKQAEKDEEQKVKTKAPKVQAEKQKPAE
jgi:hypothetical protein